jgi:hypothetical protein
MLEREWHGDYATVDTNAWIADRTDDHSDAQEAFDAFTDAHSEMTDEDTQIAAWLTSLGGVETVDEWGDTNVTAAPSGLYGEDGPWNVVSFNER